MPSQAAEARPGDAASLYRAIGQAADYCTGLGLHVNVIQGGRMLEVLWPNEPAGADPPGADLAVCRRRDYLWVWADPASGLQPF